MEFFDWKRVILKQYDSKLQRQHRKHEYFLTLNSLLIKKLLKWIKLLIYLQLSTRSCYFEDEDRCLGPHSILMNTKNLVGISAPDKTGQCPYSVSIGLQLHCLQNPPRISKSAMIEIGSKQELSTAPYKLENFVVLSQKSRIFPLIYDFP